MTPVGRQLRRFRRPTDRLLGAVLGVLLLALMFLPARDPLSHGLTVERRPAAELAFLLFVVAVAAVARPQMVAARSTARILPVLVVAMALFNLVDAAKGTVNSAPTIQGVQPAGTDNQPATPSAMPAQPTATPPPSR